MPGDTGDLGTTDLTGTGNDFPLDTLPDSGTTPPPDTLPANEAENPYGLAALWGQGDFIARGTLIILVGMSLYSWFLILTKLWDQARMLRQARQASRDFWTGSSLTDGLQKLTGSGNVYRAVVESGINASSHHEGKLTDKVPLTEWISGNLQRSVDRLNNDLQGGLSFLASVGSTAPFVGLFGTVWGIYHALIAIGVAGQASIDKVAGPVGEALIMTAIGLAVAVPAVLGYNLLLRRNKAILDQFRYFTNDLYATLVSSSQK
ncbi:MAG: MotA/TolQ/ExbB proton channel family protein [Gammaproteobacteria bacterium]|nr:MotA/TolQ/ExbB proton channel family protein [Gammaproteobacteria bacterium]MCP5139462.1 MotA/TolQ/ExbB proton channel family protein [Chromatiales bacterium]